MASVFVVVEITSSDGRHIRERPVAAYETRDEAQSALNDGEPRNATYRIEEVPLIVRATPAGRSDG